MAKRNKASRGVQKASKEKKYQRDLKCSVAPVSPALLETQKPTVRGPKFERAKKKQLSKEVVQEKEPEPSSQLSTSIANAKKASQKWAQIASKMGLKRIRREFIDSVKPYSPDGTRDAFHLDANNDKNRYDDVSLLDKTRVKLKNNPNDDDYIHASLVNVSPEMTIICAQGPLENTIENFWIMAVEKLCKVILQLCQFEEDGKEKCVKYFPQEDEGNEKTYDSVKVRVLSRGMNVGSMRKVTRTLLEVTHGTKIVETTHLLYGGWPDHAVPESLSTYIELRSLVQRLSCQTPVVAHCSAGIGRSGSYAAVEMACYELMVKGNRSFAVNEVVCRLRDQRTQSVQNDLQYSFVYRMTLEILLAEKLIEKSRDLSQFFEDFDDLIKRKKAEMAKNKRNK